jgi:hypothetical protein
MLIFRGSKTTGIHAIDSGKSTAADRSKDDNEGENSDKKSRKLWHLFR